MLSANGREEKTASNDNSCCCCCYLSTVLKLSSITTRRGARTHCQRMPSVLFSGLNSSGAVRTLIPVITNLLFS